MTEIIKAKSYDWSTYDDNYNTVIRAFCFGQESESILLRIEKFYNYVYVPLPLKNKNSKEYNWNKFNVELVYNDILARFGGKNIVFKPIGFKLEHNRKLYYWDNCKLYPMMKIFFKSNEGCNLLTKILKSPFKTNKFGFLNLEAHENEVNIVRKLLTERNLKFSDWLQAEGRLVPEDEKISTCKKEYIVNYKKISPIDYDVCKNWKVYPKIFSYDIECYSHRHNTMPKKEINTDVSWMISCIVQRLEDKTSRKRYCILLGECNDIKNEKFGDCEIIKIKNGDEIEMIKEFAKLIKKEDPEIITGYNIMGFDYPYLNHRLKRCGETWKICGRIENEKTDYNEFSWESSGYGHNKIGYLNMPGRISLDLLPIVKRDYSRFDTYTLDFVSNHFGIGKKNDVSPKEMFQIYEEMKKYQTKFENLYKQYNQIDEDKVCDSKIKSYYELLVESNCNTEKFKKLESKFSEAKDKVTTVLEYCIQDSELVVDLFEKINVWIGSVELSNITGVTIFELTTRGQQIRCFSQLYDACAKQNPKIVIMHNEASKLKFNGGSVGKPIPGVYRNCLCFDFASLYPSIIQAYNICYTTLVHPDDTTVKDEDCYVIEFDQEEPIDGFKDTYDLPDYLVESDKYNFYVDGEKKSKKTITKHYRLRFNKTKKGILPSLVRNLVSERRATQRIQKEYEKSDPFLYMVLGKKEFALKVSANSFFGFLGVSNNGKAPLIEAAMSITAKGRQLIAQVNEYLVNNYNAKVVYGDTDSSMIDLGIKDRKECNIWGIRISQELSGVKKGDLDEYENPHPEDKPGIFHDSVLKLEFEKAMDLFCIASKKYFALLIDKDGNYKVKLDKNNNKTDILDTMKKGIVLARRDNFVYLKNVYEEVIMSIMLEGDFKKTTDIIIKAIDDIYEGRIPYRKFTSTRSLGSNYKSASCAMKIFGDELKIAGKLVNPGDRLEFLVIKNDKENLVGKKMKLTEQYLESLKTDEPYVLDYEHYIMKGLKNPITQLYEIAFSEELKKINDLNYIKNNSRCNPIKCSDIVKLLWCAKNDNKSLSDIRDCIYSYYDYVFGLKNSFDVKFLNIHHYKDEERYKKDMEIKTKKVYNKGNCKIAKINQIKGQSKITKYIPYITLTINKVEI